MWIELIIVEAFYIYMLYVYTYAKKKFVFNTNLYKDFKKIDELKNKPIKTLDEQLQYIKLTGKDGSVFKGGFGKLILTLITLFIMGSIIKFLGSFWLGCLVVLVFSILGSLLLTKNDEFFEYRFVKSVVFFWLVGIIILLSIFFDWGVNHFILLGIFYITYLIFSKYGGVDI